MAQDKKVVLFGRTGGGKSTVANVLVTGGIEHVVFQTSDDAKGCTNLVKKEKGRGWIVTDTVGLGEAESGSMSNTEAKKMLTDFLKTVNEQYSHIIYVQRAGRTTTVDEMIWLIFSSIFEGAEDAFVVLFTGADEEWLRVNREKLPAYLKDQRILVTDIPPTSSRPVTEKRQAEIRKKSVEKLEKELIELFLERQNVESTPAIATMTDGELEEKSWSLMQYIVEQIKRLFDRAAWKKVASMLATVVNVVGIILALVEV